MKGHIHLRDGTAVDVKFTWTGFDITVYIYTEFGTELYLRKHTAPSKPSAKEKTVFHDSLLFAIAQAVRNVPHLAVEADSPGRTFNRMVRGDIAHMIDTFLYASKNRKQVVR